jgi:hypothetical protein
MAVYLMDPGKVDASGDPFIPPYASVERLGAGANAGLTVVTSPVPGWDKAFRLQMPASDPSNQLNRVLYYPPNSGGSGGSYGGSGGGYLPGDDSWYGVWFNLKSGFKEAEMVNGSTLFCTLFGWRAAVENGPGGAISVSQSFGSNPSHLTISRGITKSYADNTQWQYSDGTGNSDVKDLGPVVVNEVIYMVVHRWWTKTGETTNKNNGQPTTEVWRNGTKVATSYKQTIPTDWPSNTPITHRGPLYQGELVKTPRVLEWGGWRVGANAGASFDAVNPGNAGQAVLSPIDARVDDFGSGTVPDASRWPRQAGATII